MKKVVLASGNAGKIREMADYLAEAGLQIESQNDLGVVEAEETGLTFVENAILKARNAADHTKLAAVADDSGLVVDALQGAPGIYSARFAQRANKDQLNAINKDAANNAYLLELLQDTPKAARTAHFYCVMVYLRNADDPAPIIAQGIWSGRILAAPAGDAGFGYDPLFWVEDMQCTSAQLTREQKHNRSHRGKALRLLLEELKKEAM